MFRKIFEILGFVMSIGLMLERIMDVTSNVTCYYTSFEPLL